MSGMREKESSYPQMEAWSMTETGETVRVTAEAHFTSLVCMNMLESGETTHVTVKGDARMRTGRGDGEWKYDKRDGNGTFGDKEESYEGGWRRNAKEGFGTHARRWRSVPGGVEGGA